MVVDPISTNTQTQRHFLNCEELRSVPNRDLNPRVSQWQVKDFYLPWRGWRRVGSVSRLFKLSR
jgi:hypothetical protein